MDLGEDVLAGVGQMSAEDLDALGVNVSCAGSVVFRFHVGELIREALSVEVLLRVLGLMQ